MTQLLEGPRGRLGVAPPGVDLPFASEVRFQFSRVRCAVSANGVEYLLFQFRQAGRLPGMQQPPDRPRKKAVGVQHVLFEIERRVTPLEVACTIPLHPVPQDQILRPRRRSNRIGLDERQPMDRGLQGGRPEEGLRDRVSAQALESREGHERCDSTAARSDRQRAADLRGHSSLIGTLITRPAKRGDLGGPPKKPAWQLTHPMPSGMAVAL